MTVRQRLRALKLLKYQQTHPEEARRMGIQVCMVQKGPENREEMK